jgi:hypothetical protein
MHLDGSLTIDTSLGVPEIHLTDVVGDSATVVLAKNCNWVDGQTYLTFDDATELAKVKARSTGIADGYARYDNGNIALVGDTVADMMLSISAEERIGINVLVNAIELDAYLDDNAMMDLDGNDGFWYRAVLGNFEDVILGEGYLTKESSKDESGNYYKIVLATLPAHRFYESIEIQGEALRINKITYSDGSKKELSVLNLALKGVETFAGEKLWSDFSKAVYQYGKAAMEMTGDAENYVFSDNASFAEGELEIVDTACGIDTSKNRPTSPIYVKNISNLMGDALGIRFTTNAAFIDNVVEVLVNDEKVATYSINREKGYFDIFVSADEIDTEFNLKINIDGKSALNMDLSLKGVIEFNYNANKNNAQVIALAQLAQACYNVVAPEQAA